MKELLDEIKSLDGHPSLAENFVLEGKEVLMLQGIYQIHFEAVIASRGSIYGGAKGNRMWEIFHNGKPEL